MRRTASRRTICRGARIDLGEIVPSRGDGEELRREVVRHPGAVCALPIADAEHESIIAIENYHPAIGRRLWDLPAGTHEPGESPEASAARELVEETGYRARRITGLASFVTTPGMTDDLMHAYVATDLKYQGEALDPGEDIRVTNLRCEELHEMIESGGKEDAKSLLILLLALRRGLLRVPQRELEP